MRTDLEVSTLADVVIQKLEKVVGFLGLEPDDTADEARVDVECFLARHWVAADERVLSMDLVCASTIATERVVRTSV